MRKRRFEILLPLKLNDGRRVDDDLIYLTREELVAKFGAVTVNPNTVLRFWVYERARYEDELLRFVIDVDDTEDNLLFFSEFKSTLLERYQQIEIYMASYPIDLH